MLIQKSFVHSAPTAISGLVAAARQRLSRRPRAALRRVVRREVQKQMPDRETLIDDILDAPGFRAQVEQEFAREREQRAETLAPTVAQVNRDFSADVFFGSGSRYDRTLVPSRFAELAAEITELTGRRDVRSPMQQAYRQLLAAETNGLGRIAGSNYNILGKLVVPPLLSPPAGPILEIGTLFGLFSPLLVRQFRRVGEFRHLTVIDPLEGIQVQPEMAARTDPTGTPVTTTVARHNLEGSGLTPDEFRIVQGFSTDHEAQAEVADRAYGVVIVDGDHSEDGVYSDLWWTETITLPGGVVVMDDFGDPKWPGVERAARRYLADGGRMELLGTAATSGYLRMPI